MNLEKDRNRGYQRIWRMQDMEINATQIDQKRLVSLFKDIKRLNSDETRFCFLIGAGASKSSGIKTGGELSKEWYETLKNDLAEDELTKWKNNNSFDENNIGAYYPHLYQKRYEIAPQIGYEEFKKMMENIEPGLGYIILSQIITSERHNFVITTNFDYLIEDSVRMYTSKKPFSAGHETLAEFISSQTERPTIIKVHRDLFLHPFNDNEQTRSLKDEWKKALTPILRNFNLLVLGYGGNDGSLMEYLSSIEPKDRKPIFWCIRNENEVNDKINTLLDKKDFLVRIEGFDELMISLNDALDYDIFEKLDNPEEHPFVLAAKRRIEDINKKLKELLDRLHKDKDNINKGTKELFTGAMKYLFEAFTEKDESKINEIYQNGLSEYPDDKNLVLEYANFLYSIQKNYDKAEEFYKKAIGLESNNATLIGNYANFISEIRRENDVAEELYKEAIQLEPNNAINLGNFAVFLSEIRNDYDVAEELYKEAIQLEPNNAHIIGNYANFLRSKRSRYDSAEELYKKAIELEPQNATLIGNYANFLSEIRRKYDRAEELYKEAIELEPNNAYNLGNYAHLLIVSKKDFVNAEKHIDKALQVINNIVDTDLLAELWFYRYAYYYKWLNEAEQELSKLITEGVKSIGWNLEQHVIIAKDNNHPNIQKLQEFCDKITKQTI